MINQLVEDLRRIEEPGDGGITVADFRAVYQAHFPPTCSCSQPLLIHAGWPKHTEHHPCCPYA